MQIVEKDEVFPEIPSNLGEYCFVTPDLQVIEPGTNRANTALLFGLRVQINFQDLPVRRVVSHRHRIPRLPSTGKMA